MKGKTMLENQLSEFDIGYEEGFAKGYRFGVTDAHIFALRIIIRGLIKEKKIKNISELVNFIKHGNHRANIDVRIGNLSSYLENISILVNNWHRSDETISRKLWKISEGKPLIDLKIFLDLIGNKL